MCGIVGVINGGRLNLNAKHVQKMAEKIAYRGPDSHGIWNQDDAILGHRRLAIVDLSSAGHQPMVSHNRNYVLTYNGEIYNHLDLRAELDLEKKTHWKGHSDTETLIEAFSLWGVEKTLHKANGMFAFALWDIKQRVLTLARDRFGEKPLLYSVIGKSIIFASELKAFHNLAPVDLRPNTETLSLYLKKWNVPAPHSIAPSVKKIMPGHFLTWSAESGSKITCYWSATDGYERGNANQLDNLAEAADELEKLLSDAVKIRMMSDVPLGALLSGGIDSSLVAALMQKNHNRAIDTFSIGFENAEFDESPHAEAVAKQLGTNHRTLKLTEVEALANIPKLGAIYDEPFGDSSQLPTYLVCALTRKYVMVALTGDGFDELFSGYARYVLAEKAWRYTSKIPGKNYLSSKIGNLSDSTISNLAKLLSPIVPRGVNPSSLQKKIRGAGQLLKARSAHDLYARYMTSWHDPSELLLDKTPSNPQFKDDWATRTEQLSKNHDRFMLDDQLDYLPNDILCKVDRASMAVSLETRIPALDPRVADFAWRIPTDQRWQDGKGKGILRKILYRHVDQEIVDRPKRGFAAPIEAWLKGPIRPWAEDLLSEARIKRQGLLDSNAVQMHWKNFLGGGTTTHSQIWTVLMMQTWLESVGF